MNDQKFLVGITHSKVTDRLGIKGDNLRNLLCEGFAVPETHCLTAEAYEFFLERNGLWGKISPILCNHDISSYMKAKQIRQIFLGATIPGEIQEEIIEDSIMSKGSGRWAIRSSSNFEDLKMASFAGLHDTYLNIEGYDQIVDAIKKCWISLWSERAIVYRERHSLDHSAAVMAVLIQRMVEAKWSGVVFTVHPLSSQSNTMLIEYCDGIGEALVSGKVTPKTVSIEKETMSVSHSEDSEAIFFEYDQLLKLGKLSLKIEETMGSPQDIEWVHDGTSFSILQSRPISSNAISQVTTPDKIWTRANIGEVLPDAVTPLTWAIFRTTLMGQKLSEKTAEEGANDRKFDQIALINGRGYVRLDLFLDSFCYLPFVTPEIMNLVLGVKMPANIKDYERPRGIVVSMAKGLFLLALSGIFPRLSWMAKSLPSLAAAKSGGLEKIIEWNRLCFRLHLKCTAYAVGAFAFLVCCLRRWIPNNIEELIPLIMVGNADLQTAAQGTNLLDLARYVNDQPALKKLMFDSQNWIRVESQLASINGGAKFLSMLEGFLAQNGARAAGEFELAVPRWREDPSFVLMIIKRFLSAADSNFIFPDQRTRLKKREKAIGEIADQLTPLKRCAFFRALRTYRNFSTFRENMKYRLMEGYSELRNRFTAMAKTLVNASVLSEEADVFFLEPQEIKALMNARCGDEGITRLAAERRKQYEMLKKEPAPDLMFYDMFTTNHSVVGRMSGIGCSPGVAEGIARVLKDISEATLLEPGEILVTPHTDPGWTPLFIICKGLVTETGGFLSHGATVAREYGIPAVVSVAGATEKIKTGDLIKVDGNRGMVVVVESSLFKDSLMA